MTKEECKTAYNTPTMTEQDIERTLNWYCLDCSCNGQCKDHKCAFYSYFKQYLEGNDNALPPKDEWNVHHPFHRFHRQLIHNLEREVADSEAQNTENEEWYRGFIKGQEMMLTKVKAEIAYLAKDE